MKIRFFITLFVAYFSIVSVYAQSVDTLNSNSQYVEILKSLKTLNHQKDSIKNQLQIVRDSVMKNPQSRATLIKVILDMESKQFEYENQIANILSQKSLLEEEFVLNKLEDDKSDSTKTVSVYVLDLDFVKNNISDEERRILVQEHSLDTLYHNSILKINNLYSQIQKIDSTLRTQGLDIQDADSLINSADSINRISLKIQMDFKNIWGNIYDTKIYVYSRMMEKLNTSQDVLESLNNKGRNIRADLSDIQQSLFAASFYSYFAEKKLSNEYEKIVAGKIGALNTVDSLNSIVKNENYKRLSIKNIVLPNYIYADYEVLGIYKAFVVKQGDEIRTVVVPTVGEVYYNRVVTLTKALSPSSVIRKLQPLYKMVNDKKQTEYYAGVYRTHDEAKADIKRLSSLGLRPTITKFKEGGKVLADGSIYPVDAAESLFSLEFKFMDDALEAKLKELAPAKQITVIDNIYTFGVFDDYNEALAIQKDVWADSKLVKIKK